MESGLLVKFNGVDKDRIEFFLNHSLFYGYEIEENLYLFPSPNDEIENNILERALTNEFNKFNIKNYYFEVV